MSCSLQKWNDLLQTMKALRNDVSSLRIVSKAINTVMRSAQRSVGYIYVAEMIGRATRGGMVMIFIHFTLDPLALEREPTSFTEETFARLSHGGTDTLSTL